MLMLKLKCYNAKIKKHIFKSCDFTRSEFYSSARLFSVAYSRFLSARFIILLSQSYFRRAPCDERESVYLAVYISAMCIYRYTQPGLSLITCLRGGRSTKLWGRRTVVMVTEHTPRYQLISESDETSS